jgi:uncharacterized protein with HEPN domain
MKDQNLLLNDILEYSKKAIEFTKGLTFEQFVVDNKTFLATVRCLEIIGEASKKIDENIKSLYRDIPWKKITGMRDVIIHNYDGINKDIVWNTVINNLPEIIKIIEKSR